MRSVTGALPKPLAPVNGRPLLDYHLSYLAREGVQDVLILAGYGADQIEAFCGDGSKWGLNLRTITEASAAGTAGAVLQALDHLQSRFLVLYGDTIFDFDMGRLVAFHARYAPDATLFVHPNDHPQDSDLVEADEDDRISLFHPYPHSPEKNLPNLVNAGLYILEKEALVGLAKLEGLPAKPDFGKHVFPLMLAMGKDLRAYRSPEYIKDAGTPERLAKVGRDLLSGRVERSSLRYAAPAIFIDRDGTLIEEGGYIRKPEEVILLPGVGPALALLNSGGYRTALVTNQPVIARGECDEAGLRQIHNRLETLLGYEGAYVDAIYYCPHHPDGGFPGERPELKITCDCRKPNIGMIEQARIELNADLSDSWMIGDTTTDLLSAQRAGVRSVLVGTGLAGRDGKYPVLPDFECASFADVADLILRRWPAVRDRAAALVVGIQAGSILLVGGQARSGKSTWAAGISEALKRRGTPSAVIPLDCWLRGEKDRVGGSVMDRYDMAAVCGFLADARLSPGRKTVPRYDRVERRSVANGAEIRIPEGAVLIVEGVPALADPGLRDMAGTRIYVERSEPGRLRTMTENYRWRGWDESRIKALLAERATEEAPFIEATRAYAEIVLEGPDFEAKQGTGHS